MLLAGILTTLLLCCFVLQANAARAIIGLLSIAAITIWVAGQSGILAGYTAVAQGILLTASAVLLLFGAWRKVYDKGASELIWREKRWYLNAAILFMPLMLFAATAWWTWRDVETSAVSQARHMSLEVAEQGQRVLEVQDGLLRAALARVNGMTPEEVAADTRVHSFLNDLASSSGMIDVVIIARVDTGKIVAWSRPIPAAGFDLAGRGYMRALRDGAVSYVGEIIRSKVSGEAGFTLSRREPGTVLCAISLIRNDKLTSFYSGIRWSKNDVFTLARADGQVLFHLPSGTVPDLHRLGPGSIFMRWRQHAFDVPAIAPSTYNQGSRLWDIATVENFPVYAIYGLDASLIWADWVRRIVPFGLLAAAAAAVLAFLIARMQHSAAEAAEARADANAQRSLAALSERLSIALESANAGAWEWELPNTRPAWSPETFTLFGLDPEEKVPPFDEWLERFIHPEDRPRLNGELRSLLASQLSEFTMEYRAIHPDRGVRWLLTRGRIERGKDGHPIRSVGLSLDITEAKGREKQIDLLMREVNHRSKNMLALVLAVARQTAATNPSEFIPRFEERIRALSASQDLLVKNEWKGVDIEELIRTQLAHFRDLVDTRISLRGPRLTITAPAAQAIGMSIHELATNAGKYGSLSGEGGRVEVSWSLSRADEGCEVFWIEWCESGGPPVAPPSKKGFGSVVLCRISEESLDADARLEYLRSGLCWHLKCAAAEAVDRSGVKLRHAAASS